MSEWKLNLPSITSELARIPTVAEGMYERLIRSIIEFEKKLDQSKEVGARLANFGGRESISIDAVGYCRPDLIKFYGKNAEGHEVELLQHVSRVNVLLVAVPTQNDPPRRIGFILEEQLTGSAKKAPEE